jgi:hypothetical protein
MEKKSAKNPKIEDVPIRPEKSVKLYEIDARYDQRDLFVYLFVSRDVLCRKYKKNMTRLDWPGNVVNFGVKIGRKKYSAMLTIRVSI